MDMIDMKKELFEELLEELHKEVALISAYASKKADEASSKAANEESACAEGKEDAEAKLANAAEPAKEEAKAEEAKAEEAKPQEKAEEEEVIKLEALNSSPKPSITDEPAWKKLYGKDFIRAFESGKLFD